MRQLKQSEIKSLRNHILKKQNGKCWICGKEPKIATLDHEHKKKVKGTGQIRGVLCNNCNVFIARIENNSPRYCISKNDLPEILRKTANYFEKKQYNFIHPSEKPKPKRLKKTSVTKLMKLFQYHHPNRKVPPCFNYGKQDKKRGKKLNRTLTNLYHQFDLEPSFLKGK